MTSDKDSVSAGTVAFAAKNTGATEHDLIVLKTDLAPNALVIKAGIVDEKASGTLIGEIELDKLGRGESASMTLELEPGSYVLICNLPAHYLRGMRVAFEVE